jgi:hypothetical protein
MQRHDESLPHVKAHRFSSSNRRFIPVSDTCGCFCCISILRPVQIYEWISGRDKKNDTALCPRCGIDSVIPSSSGFPITKEFLKQMYNYWLK